MAEETGTRGNLNIKRKRKHSRFLSCFGFSYRDDKYLPELKVCDDQKKTRRWFSSAKLRLKNSVKETIAVYNPPIFKKIDGKKQTKEVRYDNFTGKCRSPASLDRKTVKFAAIETLLSYDQTLSFDGKPGKEKDGGNTHKYIVWSGKPQTDTSKRLEVMKVEAKAGYQGDSAVKRSSREMVTMSTQLRNSLGASKKFSEETTGKFGPAVGMSVLVVIMAMMLLWGKISAIFYTAAWLYFLHYYRMMGGKIIKEIEGKGSNSVNIMKTIDSKDLKKTALLEGPTEKKHMWFLK
ncbi:hypothetical protein C5167_034568 [Papaver somniferum]|uniref:Uncharacterized protein n=1 Tax=Papaver somniferum TaxID=3469 RepID=A0A4Y7KEY3_PAPSO|nr:uncharacterized protein LOC113293350 [Papaver somniferum]RZC71406.1 hypothetical protein C5167_034568 [Papaver somniferum]